MSLTPIQGFYFPLCTLRLICSTGVFMFEEEIPIDKMCLESDYVKKQQQQKPPTLNYKLDGARLNWSQPITCPVLKKM